MIKIDVRYYDNVHQTLIAGQPYAQRAHELVEHGVLVSELELLSCALFVEQKNSDGWRTYAELSKKVPTRIEQFRDYFDVANGTIRSKFAGERNTSKYMTERAGVGVSIVVANRLFGLTEADWARIGESKKHKTLDFQLASDGARLICVEAKGTVVDNVAHKVGSVSTHKASILDKKAAACPVNAVKLGTIAAVPTTEASTAVCWLVDPPADEPPMEPRKYKLVSRMTFYLRVLRGLTSSALLTALADRIEAIVASSDYTSLDGVPLRSASQARFRRVPMLFRNKTVVPLVRGGKHGRAFGRTLELKGGDEYRFAYLGVDDDVYRLLAGQNFEEIVRYKSPYSMDAVEKRDIEAVLPVGRRALREGGAEREWRRVKVSGPVQVLASGLTVGVLRQHAKNPGL